MKYYIAADGGGTKLFAVLYDEEFNIIAEGAFGGTNHLFRPKDEITRDTNALADKIIPDHITEVEAFDFSIVGDTDLLIEALSKKASLKDCNLLSEGTVALYSAGYEYGILAQAGTGSDAFLIQPDCSLGIGGWGAFFGDEGSGYDIGVKTIRAAIYAHDGRGPKTAILDILMREWELNELVDIIFLKLAKTPDYRKMIASATRICSMAAELGDEVAIGILQGAGEELGLQVRAAARKYGKPIIGPIVTSGGAWKGSHYMRDSFIRDVQREMPDAVFKKPVFEPLVGSVISRHKDKIGIENLIDILKIKFNRYILR